MRDWRSSSHLSSRGAKAPLSDWSDNARLEILENKMETHARRVETELARLETMLRASLDSKIEVLRLTLETERHQRSADRWLLAWKTLIVGQLVAAMVFWTLAYR